MKYLIIDANVRANSGGIQSILNDVYDYARRDLNNQYEFVLGCEGLLKEAPNIKITINKKLQNNYFYRILFDTFLGSKYCAARNPDRIIDFQNTAILHSNIRQMVYVHQALPFIRDISFSFRSPKERKFAFYQKLVGSVIRLNLRLFRRGAVTVQSDWMKSSVQAISKVSVYTVKPDVLLENTGDAELGTPSKCFFYPSTAMEYKNHLRLARAFLRLPMPVRERMPLLLTITKDEFIQMYGQLPEYKHISFLGRISHIRTLKILQHATLVFPSRIESLGLPVLEAMRYGRPIAASRIAPVVEMTRNYPEVFLFSPTDEQELEQKLKKSLQVQPLRAPFFPSGERGWKAFFIRVNSL